MDKKEIADILETILDGLTKGESTEKKIEELKKFYTDELDKVNNKNQFFERVIRLCLMERYFSLRESLFNRFETLNGANLFFHQSKTIHTTQPVPGLGFDLDDFNHFVDEYLTAARNDTLIGIKEEKEEE
jgi:hypothetical protein